jgi:myotubularin-related protein 9
MEQFCISFEFNEELLIFLFDNAYSSEFGTFLCNSESERIKIELSNRTSSIWYFGILLFPKPFFMFCGFIIFFINTRTFINSPENVKNYLNHLYEPNEVIIWPSLFIQSLTLWSSLFLRYQRKQNPIIESRSEIMNQVELNAQARERVEKIRK